MSEAVSPPAPAPVSTGASLYPSDGGAAAAAAAAAAAGNATSTGGDTNVGAASVAGAAGPDSVAGAAGTDSLTSGTNTGMAATGADSVSGAAGSDSIAAPAYDFKLPDTFVADDQLSAKAKTVFAAAGVPADKAQGLIDLFAEAMTTSASAQAAAHATQQTAWISEINSMPEFTGPTRETSLASIGKLFDEFGTPEAKAALNANGVGNNPALVRMMHKIASVMTEGGPAASGRPTGLNGVRKPTTVGASLYENDGKGPTR